MANKKKEQVDKKVKIPKKKLSERFNFKAMKKKAIIGGLVTAFGTVGIGGVALTKYSYDQTERTVQFKLEKISDKKTIIQTVCTQKETTLFKKWDSGWLNLPNIGNNFEDEVKSATIKNCSSEVLDRLVHTSKGTFKNNSSILDFKNEDDVDIIDNNLKADNWYEAVVKGYSFSGDGNIISLKQLPEGWNEKVAQEVKALPVKKETAPVKTTNPVSTVPNTSPDIDALQRQLDILKLQQQLDTAKKAQAANKASAVQSTIPAPSRVIVPTK